MAHILNLVYIYFFLILYRHHHHIILWLWCLGLTHLFISPQLQGTELQQRKEWLTTNHFLICLHASNFGGGFVNVHELVKTANWLFSFLCTCRKWFLSYCSRVKLSSWAIFLVWYDASGWICCYCWDAKLLADNKYIKKDKKWTWGHLMARK